MLKTICVKDVFDENMDGCFRLEGCNALICGMDNTKPIRDTMELHDVVHVDGIHYGEYANDKFKVYPKDSIRQPSHRLYYAFLKETEEAIDSFMDLARKSVASFCTGTHRGTMCVLVEKLNEV